MKRIKFKKNSTRVVFNMAIVEILCLLALYLFTYFSVTNLLKDKAVDTMNVIAKDRAEVVEDYINRWVMYVDDFSLSGIVNDCLNNPDDSKIRDTAQKYTDSYVAGKTGIEGLYIALNDTYVLTHNNPDSLNQTFRTGDSLVALQSSLNFHRNAFCTGFVVAPVTKQKVIPVYKAIRDEKGLPIGFVGGAFLSDELDKKLDHLSEGDGKNFRYNLIDCVSCTYLYSDNKDTIGTECTISELVKIARERNKKVKEQNSSGYYVVEDSGEEFFTAYHYMEQYDWIFVVSGSVKDVYSSIDLFRGILTSICVFILVALAVITRLVVKVILKPLDVIGNEISRLQDNNYEDNPVMQKYMGREDEYGKIANVVEKLKISLKGKNEIYTELLKIQSIGVLSVNYKTDEVIVINRAALRMLGITDADEFEGKLETLYEKIGENNKQGLCDIIEVLKGKDDESICEYTIQHFDNSVVYALSHGKCVDISSGEKVLMISLTDITEKKIAEKKLMILSETDALTGISNRRSGERRITDALIERENGMFIIMDANKFKYVNDTYGHEVGDLVLKAIADAMVKTFRTSDILVRLGGDEFVVFALGIKDREIGQLVVDRFFKNIEAIDIPELNGYKISMSLGAVIRTEEDNFDSLYKKADNLMYESKTKGGNAVEFLVPGENA